MKKLGIFLLIISFLLLNLKKEIEKDNINYHNEIIEKIYDNHNYKDYLGYIEIPKYNIKRIIKEGVSNEILDNNYVGLMNIKNDNLLVLAGHNINLVFHKIHYLKKGDLINLYLNKKEEYKVIETLEINIDDNSILYKKYKNKTLILITCTKDSNKRFIVIAKKIIG